MACSKTLLVFVLIVALIATTTQASSGASTTSGNTKACLRKMASYVNAICDGREFTKNAEELIVSACSNHVNIEQFINEICPDV